MSRLPMVSPDPEDPALRQMFDEVRAHGIALPNVYRVIGLTPPLLRGAQVSGARYEWVHHAAMARAIGNQLTAVSEFQPGAQAGRPAGGAARSPWVAS